MRKPPRLGRLPPALPAGDEPDVDGDVARWEHVRLEGPLDAAPGVCRVELIGCDLHRTALPDDVSELRLDDCVARGLDLANAKLRAVELSGTLFDGCRLVGASLAGSIRDVAMVDCQLDLVSLRPCELDRVEFRRSSMVEADLYGSTLRSVLFEACDLSGAELSAATMTLVDLDRCGLEGLRGVEALRGATMGHADVIALAPQLARALGIVVF